MSGHAPMDVGGMIKAAWRVFTAHWLPLVLLSAITYLPLSALAYVVGMELMPLNPSSEEAENALVVMALAISGLLLLGTFLSMAVLHHAVADGYLEGRVDWKDSLRRTVPRIPVVIGAFLITIVAVAAIWAVVVMLAQVSAILAVIGGIAGIVATFALLTLANFTFPIAVREDIGARHVLKRAWHLMSERWLATIGLLIVMGFLVGIGTEILSRGLESQLLSDVDSLGAILRGALIAQALPAILLTPLNVAALTIAYFDLRVRRGEDIGPGAPGSSGPGPLAPAPAGHGPSADLAGDILSRGLGATAPVRRESDDAAIAALLALEDSPSAPAPRPQPLPLPEPVTTGAADDDVDFSAYFNDDPPVPVTAQAYGADVAPATPAAAAAGPDAVIGDGYAAAPVDAPVGEHPESAFAFDTPAPALALPPDDAPRFDDVAIDVEPAPATAALQPPFDLPDFGFDTPADGDAYTFTEPQERASLVARPEPAPASAARTDEDELLGILMLPEEPSPAPVAAAPAATYPPAPGEPTAEEDATFATMRPRWSEPLG